MNLPTGAEFRRPPPLHHRNPDDLTVWKVCPHCKRELAEYRFYADGVPISAWSCVEHGDVQPMRSAVSDPAPSGLEESNSSKAP